MGQRTGAARIFVKRLINTEEPRRTVVAPVRGVVSPFCGLYVSPMVKLPFINRTRPTVAVIRLHGVIAAGGRGFSASLSDAGLAPIIERAFDKSAPNAVALSINSPGGSPVQSALIAARIRRLSEEKNIPVFAFCEDVAASGGYWLALAGDKIFCDANSILGSIGVISGGFGFQDLIARYGVERRIHTAGEQKSFLDPFKDENPEEVARLKNIQKQMHDNFIAWVKERRGAALTRDDVFTGEFWTGGEAVSFGLADELGHLVPKMKEMYGEKTRFAVSRASRSIWQRFGAPGAEDLLAVAENRLAFARFGL